jgi:glutaminyl-tRNA synthetase
MTDTSNAEHTPPSHFIRHMIEYDLAAGKHGGRVQTRFPPEPNGFLHIGHAKSICLNFGLAEQYHGACNMRFDDTNPEKESQEFIDAIQADVNWLGFKWHGEVRFTSAYFQQLFDFALQLIRAGKAYVCSLTPEQAREYRGSLTETTSSCSCVYKRANLQTASTVCVQRLTCLRPISICATRSSTGFVT